MGRRVVMSWSGGKDSALALFCLLEDPFVDVIGLLTTVTEEYERISMHGVRVDLLRRQAASIGLPLIEVRIPPGCPESVYESRMAAAFEDPLVASADAMASGDIYLEDVRSYREERIQAAGKEALFPIWGFASDWLASSFLQRGFRAIVTCIDPVKLEPEVCGAEFDGAFLRALPDDVDPCGERGEFHTFVYAGPLLLEPILVSRGQLVLRDGFVFRELKSQDRETATTATANRTNR